MFLYLEIRHSTDREVALMILMAYLSYMLAEVTLLPLLKSFYFQSKILDSLPRVPIMTLDLLEPALLLERHTHSVLLRDRHVALHVAQCNWELKSDNKVRDLQKSKGLLGPGVLWFFILPFIKLENRGLPVKVWPDKLFLISSLRKGTVQNFSYLSIFMQMENCFCFPLSIKTTPFSCWVMQACLCYSIICCRDFHLPLCWDGRTRYWEVGSCQEQVGMQRAI